MNSRTRVLSQHSENVSDLLVCAVCMETFDDGDHQPKLLPCHHTFCKTCLLGIVSNNFIQCPTCRERIGLCAPPPEGVTRLQTNFYLTQMREFMFSARPNLKQKGCRKHANKAMTQFCSTCEVLICAECCVTDHKEASGHVTQDMDVAENLQKHLLSVEIASAQQSIMNSRSHLQSYETELSSLSSARQKAAEDIDSQFDQYVEAVNQRRRDLKDKLVEVYTGIKARLQEVDDKLKKQETSLCGIIEQCEEAMQSGTILDMLAYRGKLGSKNREVLREGQSHVVGNNFVQFTSEENEDALLAAIQDIGAVSVHDPLPSVVEMSTSEPIASLFMNLTLTVSSAQGHGLENYPISVDIKDVQGDCIPNSIQHRNAGAYEVTFRPKISGTHKVIVKFLDNAMPGAKFDLEVKSNDPVLRMGIKGEGPGELEYPRAVAVDNKNDIYVMDTGNNRIQKFSKTGRFMFQFPVGQEQDHIYQFENISSCGIAVNDQLGRVICPEVHLQEADLAESCTVLVYSMSGELTSRFHYSEIMRRALSIAINSIGHMVIADFELNTIFIFDRKGRLLRKFGESGKGPGQFLHPTFVCAGEQDSVIVADGDNNRIQVFDKTGKFLYMFGSKGHDKGQFDMPFGVAADGHGNILVVDGGNKRIQIFMPGGVFLSCIESLGDRLSAPRGIAVTSDGFVLVADRDNHCVKKYKYLHCTSL